MNFNKIKKQFLVTSIATFSLILGFSSCAQANEQGKITETTKAEKEGIHWLTFEELDKKLLESPKMILIDFYTDWCGWCKVMDRKTYSNPDVIKYINDNFYAVKFNAEQKEPVNFKGSEFVFQPKNKAHQIAVELMGGKMSYPTTVIIEKDFKSVNPVPGFLEVPQMETILKFIAEGKHQTESFDNFSKSYQPKWTYSK